MSKNKITRVDRFSVSLEPELVEAFERYISQNNYPNRSEALRILIKKALVEDEWLKDLKSAVAGIIILIYDHHRRGLVDKLLNIQHHFTGDSHSSDTSVKILATLHIHLDHNNCLEVIAVSGRSSAIRNFYSCLKSVKGLKHISLAPATCGKNLV